MNDQMNAFNLALARASHGLTWEYPCLIWLADFIRDETGKDPAAAWRSMGWTERTARRELSLLARGGEGRTAVEMAIDVMAKREGWIEEDAPMQGMVMIGVYTEPDGDIGVPAIFDGERRWLVSGTGAATITAKPPERLWVIA